MPLTKAQKEKCVEIVEELFSHPISEVFQEPVDPIVDEVPDYFDVIQNPSDLSTVRTKLMTDQYDNLQDFKRDVNLIWENAITYNGKPSLPAFIADELSKLFQKRFYVLEEPPLEQWVNDYLKSRSVVCKLFRNAPKGLASFNFTAEHIISEYEPPPPITKLSTAEKKIFQSAEYLFEDSGIRAKFIQFVNQIEPSVELSNENFQLDLTKLTNHVRKLLIQWIVEQEKENPPPNTEPPPPPPPPPILMPPPPPPRQRPVTRSSEAQRAQLESSKKREIPPAVTPPIPTTPVENTPTPEPEEREGSVTEEQREDTPVSQ